jgi:hypothetical protein
MDAPPLSPHQRTKVRAVALALRHGRGLVRVGFDAYLVHPGGVLELLARAPKGVDTWERACEVLERASGGATPSR